MIQIGDKGIIKLQQKAIRVQFVSQLPGFHLLRNVMYCATESRGHSADAPVEFHSSDLSISQLNNMFYLFGNFTVALVGISR